MNKIDKVTTEMGRAFYLDSIGSRIEKSIVHRPYLLPQGWSEHIHLTMTHIAMIDVILDLPPLIITVVNKKHNIFR